MAHVLSGYSETKYVTIEGKLVKLTAEKKKRKGYGGRPYQKNGNCFVEQKNGDRVRKTVGYFRYDTDKEFSALAEVYRHLNVFTNYWQPTVKLTGSIFRLD